MSFNILVLESSPIKREALQEWLSYGELGRGFGQFRNGGYGRFTYTLEVLSKRVERTLGRREYD